MSKTPLYARIKQDIKHAIDSGELGEGARIPSELELADQYGVSRNPTRQALRELEIEGYITRTRRRGSFVAPLAHRAKHLHLSQGQALAIVGPHVKSPHVRGIVEGFVHRAGACGFNTMVYFMECTDRHQAELLRDIQDSGLAGVALWLTEGYDRTQEVLTQMLARRYPFVLVDRYMNEVACDLVATDNIALGRGLTERLLTRGRRRIGFLCSDQANSANRDRRRGWEAAMSDAGIEIPPGLEARLSREAPSPSQEIYRLVAHRQRPDGLVASEGWIALRAAGDLQGLGYAAPDDVALAAVDDGELSTAPTLCIAGGWQQSTEMGRQSADLLMRRVKTPSAPVEQIFLPPAWDLAEDEAEAALAAS